MAHLSEDSKRLVCKRKNIFRLDELRDMVEGTNSVYLFYFPTNRSDLDASFSQEAFDRLSQYCNLMSNQSTVCFLTSPSDAARLQPHLQSVLRFQLWVAVKTSLSKNQVSDKALTTQHIALLVFTRYKSSLRHVKTRIRYTYCPACGKTTKDYGGKKHVYHESGTLMSDVWRDIEIDASVEINPIVDRLSDLFGLEPYKNLYVIDLNQCVEFAPSNGKGRVKEQISFFGNEEPKLPLRSKLINGDCLKELRKTPEGSIDFCFADPPYNLEKKYDGYNDSLELVEYFSWCDEWLSGLAHVLKPGRTLAVLNIPLWAIRHYQYLATKLKFQSWIVWDAMSFPVRMIMPSHYSILCFSKGEPRPLPGFSNSILSNLERDSLSPMEEFFCTRASCISVRRKRKIADRGSINDLWCDIHRLKHNSRRVDHPTQLPPALMRRLFSLFTKSGETILDCFNGAGTSTLVAQQLERNFIGIELSKKYHQITVQRHKELSKGKDPFAKKNAVPEVKNSRVPRLAKQTYEVSKKVLQLDVKRIAELLDRLPDRNEVKALSKYPIEYFDNYFSSWGEVCAAARTTGMSELPSNQKVNEVQPQLFSK